ncbi:MAG TPA: hypothetical protein VFQ53_17640 [Kofleriaceae bacterium]|nr:hypothetical protein [Kofleriaceae bacterium]
MRHVWTAVVAIVFATACGTPPEVKRPDDTGANGGARVGNTTGNPAKPGGTGGGVVALKDIGCPSPSCAFHPNAGAYFTCLSGGAGTCFHFGPACTPDGACMYDPKARSYKQCTKPVEGQCFAWAGACAPASKCMIDPTDNLYKTCDDVSGGTCRKFAALCAP